VKQLCLSDDSLQATRVVLSSKQVQTLTVEEVLARPELHVSLAASPVSDSADTSSPPLTVLCLGLCEGDCEALKAALLANDCRPSIFVALEECDAAQPLAHLHDRLVHAHSDFWRLHRPLATHATAWEPAQLRVPLLAELNAWDADAFGDGEPAALPGTVAVLDGLVDDQLRAALLEELTSPSFDEHRDTAPPGEQWERETRDVEGASPTWGLTEAALLRLQGPTSPACVIELQSRLCKIWPALAHMPGDAMEPAGAAPGAAVAPLVANAAAHGDAFGWHRDAQPAALSLDSPWAERFGRYRNGAPGKPRLFSLVLYLNRDWPERADAETLFLDARSGAGLLVRPRAGRAVVMSQDVLHRLSAPSARCGRLRFSLVWKLALWPSEGGGETEMGLALPQWGPALRIGL
jgi:hypothetical protein